MGYLSESWKQFTVLLNKNWLLSKRNKTVTLLQLVAPFFIMIVVKLIEVAMNSNITKAPEFAEVRYPTSYGITSIPTFNCIAQFAPCYNLAYAPKNAIVEQLVGNVAAKSGFSSNSLIGFDTPDELDDYLVAHPWSIPAAYVFSSWLNGTWEYAVQYNDTEWRSSSDLLFTSTAQDYALPMNIMMDYEIISYQQSLENIPGSPSIRLQWDSMQFPQKKNIDNPTIKYMYPIFYMATLMLNFVLLSRAIIQEKETRLKEGMRMMGLKELPYWASWFAHYTLINIFASLLLIVAGHIFQLALVTENAFEVLFLVLFLFGESMIGAAFLLSSLMKSSMSTVTVGFVIWVLCGITFNVLAELVYNKGGTASMIVSLISPFAFGKGVFDLTTASNYGGLTWKLRGERLFSEFPMTQVYEFLIIDTVIYVVLGVYITIVSPGEFGVPKPFYFFLTPSYWFGKKSSSKKHRGLQPDAVVNDDDVISEERVVKDKLYSPTTAVVIEDLMKVYSLGFMGLQKFKAVKGISFTIENNTCFCLLGPNGAGKTTTFSMLSGLFPSSGGDATIFGYSIADEMDEIRKIMGMCPQHDLLWDQMTAREHLRFFCQFKHVENIEKEVENKLELVGLTEVADVPVSVFSGGEKRRLSVALATVGDPKIVYLDEPTTGMDPVSRRQVWEIIAEAKKGRVVILTTHSMEEADVLSDRIGIVAKGQLRCIGNGLHLKNKFGSGYQVKMFFSSREDHRIFAEINRFSKKVLPEWEEYFKAADNDDRAPGSFVLSIPYTKEDSIGQLLGVLEDNMQSLGIDEVTMNLSSLEDVFLKIAMESEKEVPAQRKKNTESTSPKSDKIRHNDVKSPSFGSQFSALFFKNLAYYKYSWFIPLIQVFIMIMFLGAMKGMPSTTTMENFNNPHPFIVPPHSPFTRLSQIRPTIPYYYQNPSQLGSCCTNGQTGFLGSIYFSLLNSSSPNYNGTGIGSIPTNNWEFVGYDSDRAMFDMLYDTANTGWVAAYVFRQFDDVNNQFEIGLVHSITADGLRAARAPVNLITNALLKLVTRNNEYTIRVGEKQFPTWEHKIVLPGGYTDGIIWVVLACSLAMVPILTIVALEKERRLRYMMIIAGMRMSAYWTSLFVLAFIFYLVIVMLFLALAVAMGTTLFSYSYVGAMLLVLIIYAFNQVSFAFLLSSLFNNANAASVSGYMIILFFALLGNSISLALADLGTGAEIYGASIFPHIGLAVFCSLLRNNYFPLGHKMTAEDFANDKSRFVVLVMALSSIVFLLIHQYLEAVYPSEYNSNPTSPVFFLTKRFWTCTPKKAKKGTDWSINSPLDRIKSIFSRSDKSRSKFIVSQQIHVEPNDAAAERTNACEGGSKFPLRVPGITKVFKNDRGVKVAVDNLAIAVNPNECYGLLGPNGGGKTTLVNLVSGLYSATAGDAIVSGNSVVEKMQAAQRHIGVCPQDSVLWPELTARQHLELFGRLRNLSGRDLEEAILVCLEQTLLADAANRPAGGYSGGMKRRLSLAIALIGNPTCVLLDEPTTGVDPYSRRVVWDAINGCKSTSTIVLTSHNMEEADILCDRLAVVVNGRVASVGRSHELKVRYGVGYTLTVLYKTTSDPQNIINFVSDIVAGAKLVEQLPGSLNFSLPKQATKVSILFNSFQKSSEYLGVTDWALLQSNLEDVLIKCTDQATQSHEV